MCLYMFIVIFNIIRVLKSECPPISDNQQCKSTESSNVSIHTPNNYNFVSLCEYGINVSLSTTLKFKVRACNDAYIGLFECYPNIRTTRYYEIVIVGWKNTMSVIRNRKQQGKSKADVEARLFDCKRSNSFWISWKNGQIKVGTGECVDSGIVMEWNDTNPYAVNYAAVCSGWGSTADWVIKVPRNQGSCSNIPCQNGRYCYMNGSDGTKLCKCERGWEGRYCETENEKRINCSLDGILIKDSTTDFTVTKNSTGNNYTTENSTADVNTGYVLGITLGIISGILIIVIALVVVIILNRRYMRIRHEMSKPSNVISTQSDASKRNNDHQYFILDKENQHELSKTNELLYTEGAYATTMEGEYDHLHGKSQRQIEQDDDKNTYSHSRLGTSIDKMYDTTTCLRSYDNDASGIYDHADLKPDHGGQNDNAYSEL